jgi:hypothetical protein
MDNFNSISVGAGDWIEIEGCKEEVRQKMLFACSISLSSRMMIVIFTKIYSEHIVKILDGLAHGSTCLSIELLSSDSLTF